MAALCAVLPLPESLHAAETCQSSAIEVLEDRRLEPALLRIVNGAKKEVWIGAFMFKVGDRSNNAPARLFEALVRLHRSGVRIRVILERPEDPLSDLAGFNSRTARLLLKEGIEVIMDRADRRSHMKVIVVDNYGGRTESPPRKATGWGDVYIEGDDWGGSYKAISGPNSVLSLLFARTDGDGDGIPDLLQ